jgi:hypothetical protein
MNNPDLEHLAKAIHKQGIVLNEYMKTTNDSLRTLLETVRSLRQQVNELEKRKPVSKGWSRRHACDRRPEAP